MIYFKSILRSMAKNIGRLISIVFIVFVGITCYAGLGTLSAELNASFNNYYESVNLSDLNIKDTTEDGFSEDDILEFENDEDIDEVDAFTSLEFDNDGDNTRLYIFNSDNHDLNNLTLIQGRTILDPTNEVYVEQSSETIKHIELGSTISIDLTDTFDMESDFILEYTVVGIVQNPLNISLDGDVDLVNQETLDVMIYSYDNEMSSTISYEIFGQTTEIQINLYDYLPYTDLYVRFKHEGTVDYFSKYYEDFINEEVTRLETIFSDEDYVYLSLYENKGYNIIVSYSEKVNLIALVIPLFFLVVTALVVLTTMTRMIDEERAQIGCCSSIGLSNGMITIKYVFISCLSTVLGAAIGMVIGLFGLASVIYPGFESLFFLPERAYYYQVLPGIIASLIVVLSTIIISIFAVRKELKTEPAFLLLPKSPKSGKKILLERIKFLWKPIPFRFKSSLRNIFRNPKNFWTTMLSCAGSTIIVFIGFSLLDVTNHSTDIYITGLIDSMIPISIMIIVLSLILTVFVIYNITNMNIGERDREIATLQVLGYKDREVCMYIYREIALTGAVGIFVGIPSGAGVTYLLLKYLEYGSLNDVQWYTYILSGALVVVFVLIVDLLLIPKILKIDMTSSLKSVD